MVRMGTVWDRTMEVLSGRGAVIVRVAMLTVLLPSVVRAAMALAPAVASSAKVMSELIGLVLAIVTLAGTLAITALASDPAIEERGAYRIARETLPGALAAVVLIGVVLIVLAIPGIALLVAAGFDLQAAMNDTPQPALASGPVLWAGLYLFVYALVFLWAVIRIAPLYAVIVNERRGVSAIRRTFALTRGFALRLFGLLILYAIVASVVWSAATSVFGLVFRLLLGPDQAGLVQFLTAVVAAVVLTGLTILQTVFCARLYALIREVREVHAGASPLA